MSEKQQSEAAGRLTEAFGESYRQAVQGAVEIQQRNARLAQGWAEAVTGVVESQAETNRALTRAMESFVKLTEETVKSQERTSRALSESLDAYRDVLEKATSMQERNERLVRDFLGGAPTELMRGMEQSQNLAKLLTDGSERQMEAFQRMFQEAMESYTNLLNAPFALYQKNLEAFGKRGQ
jgi:predicted component of type VI protein secretion system